MAAALPVTSLGRDVLARPACCAGSVPADLATTVEFLLSEQARNITGTTLTVDAGNTA